MLHLLLLSVLGIAQAENEARPLRPTTHPADLALSTGAVENFQRLYCDPETVVSKLKPSTAAEGTGHLYIRNEYTGWVDITVGEERIGRLQPLTTAVIHGVAAGTYSVSIAVERMQYTDTVLIDTISEDLIATPGNARSAVAIEKEFRKPGLEDNRVFTTGKLAPYTLATAIPSTEAENTEE